eukprot:TRINITY_DN10106_c0_g1_i1.p1 TRINITY_DN10106_c0_g1~~TRINITY_DN10106_c0_g1_i1.p1  ORF type:complete len:368 (-),score=62.11 TRINITY_DN10106_c0_g1_i1:58-1161(-)
MSKITSPPMTVSRVLSRIGSFTLRRSRVRDPIYLQWEKIETFGEAPTARFGHSMTSYDGRLFVFGGFTDEEEVPEDLQVFIFNIAECEWSQPTIEGIPPENRGFHSATTIGDKIWIFGGNAQQNDVVIFDPINLEWIHPKLNGNYPTGRQEHAAQYHPPTSTIYFFGGGGSSVFLNDMLRLRIKDQRWEIPQIPFSGPKERCSHTMTEVDGKLFIFGGFDGKAWKRDMWRYDAGEWIMCSSDGSKKRAAHSAVRIDKKIIIYGGFNGKKKLSDVSVFDTERSQWMSSIVMGKGPEARSYHAACHSGNTMYVFGGSLGQEKMNDLYRVDVVTCPSLKNLCMVFIRRHPDLNLKVLPQDLVSELKNIQM